MASLNMENEGRWGACAFNWAKSASLRGAHQPSHMVLSLHMSSDISDYCVDSSFLSLVYWDQVPIVVGWARCRMPYNVQHVMHTNASRTRYVRRDGGNRSARRKPPSAVTGSKWRRKHRSHNRDRTRSSEHQSRTLTTGLHCEPMLLHSATELAHKWTRSIIWKGLLVTIDNSRTQELNVKVTLHRKVEHVIRKLTCYIKGPF